MYIREVRICVHTVYRYIVGYSETVLLVKQRSICIASSTQDMYTTYTYPFQMEESHFKEREEYHLSATIMLLCVLEMVDRNTGSMQHLASTYAPNFLPGWMKGGHKLLRK